MKRKKIAAAFAAAASLVTGLVLAVPGPAFAGTNVGGIEAETMTGGGAGQLVYSDPTASGGQALELIDNVTTSGTVTTSQPSDHLWIKAHTDSGTTATMTVKVDGATVATNAPVSVSTWGGYTWAGSWTAGTHTVSIALTNAISTNLYLDNLNFAAPAETGTKITTVYTTGYDWWDNTPPGSSVISNPVIHSKAGGTGTWSDPVTVAVGHSLATGSDVLDYAAGTKFYVPNVQKYFIVEDTCGDANPPSWQPQDIGCHKLFNTANHNDAPAGSTVWIDLWVGGQNSNATEASNCMNAITAIHTVILNPSVQTYKVHTGDIDLNGTTCQTGYGETPLLQ